MESHFRVKGSSLYVQEAVEFAEVLLAHETKHSPVIYAGVVSSVLVASFSRETCFVVVSYGRGVISFIVMGSETLIEGMQDAAIEHFGPLVKEEK